MNASVRCRCSVPKGETYAERLAHGLVPLLTGYHAGRPFVAATSAEIEAVAKASTELGVAAGHR